MNKKDKTNCKPQKEKFTLASPVRRSELPNNFVDELRKTYPTILDATGEPRDYPLEFTTEDIKFLSRENEIDCVKKNGLAAIGFYALLRTYMSKILGFGLCKTNRDFDKSLLLISIDYDIDADQLKKLCNQLYDAKIIFDICDSKGNVYIASFQQIFNYETLCWTRAKNRFYKNQKKEESEAGQNIDEESNEESSDDSNDKQIADTPAQKEVSADDSAEFGLTDSDGKNWF